jgi:hypothetical protein
MADPVYHSGSDGLAFSTPKLGSAPTITELAVTGWDMDIDPDIKKYDNNKDGRFRQRGNQDCSGTLKLHYDSANQPHLTNTTGTLPSLRDGDWLNLQLNPDGTSVATNAFRLLAIVDHVKPSTEFTGTVDYECTYMLQSGTVLYPGDPAS